MDSTPVFLCLLTQRLKAIEVIFIRIEARCAVITSLVDVPGNAGNVKTGSARHDSSPCSTTFLFILHDFTKKRGLSPIITLLSQDLIPFPFSSFSLYQFKIQDLTPILLLGQRGMTHLLVPNLSACSSLPPISFSYSRTLLRNNLELNICFISIHISITIKLNRKEITIHNEKTSYQNAFIIHINPTFY